MAQQEIAQREIAQREMDQREMAQRKEDRIAQWAFDTRSVLARFHLWLEDVEVRVLNGEDSGPTSFSGSGLERAFTMAAAVTALGTRLFGRYGEGKDLDAVATNRIKKDADAMSSYALSEALWCLTRNLPENHALMVSLGEGLMPKAGESPEMGSNPLLGFGRVYARPQVAHFVDRRVHRLINDPGYCFDDFWQELQAARITVWGAAIDTLENTSRFAKGKASGPMTVLHVYDQPLMVSEPYEGYIGVLSLPERVREEAERRSILLTYHTPRRLVMEAIRAAFPDIPADRIHVWTLGGKSREARLGGLWQEWRELGVHLVEPGWKIPGGGAVFTDSGTYAPIYRVGAGADEAGRQHLFLIDGYAASAEAIQAASLDPVLDVHTAMSLFSSTFKLPTEQERHVMQLDPENADFANRLQHLAGVQLATERVEDYRASIRAALNAEMPCARSSVTIDDFFPRKAWRGLAISGFMLKDPYSGAPGVETLDDNTYRVTVRTAAHGQIRELALTLRLLETFEQSRLVFSPLLDRFYAGEDYRRRAVKVSDSGRLRNELQTLCLGAIDYFGDDGIRVDFNRLGDAVMPADKKQLISEVLRWYKKHHPIWFKWLAIAED